MRMKTTALLTALVLAGTLAGCGSSVELAEAPIENRTPNVTAPGTGAGSALSSATASGVGPGAATASGTAQSSVATVDLARQGASAPGAALARIVYFDFDSFVLKDEFKTLVDSHARVLSANRGKRITIEGHTDERGGREYNLALGQKRAEAVAKSLTLLGVNETQIESVSFGEERPVDPGHDEAAWVKNRRAELKDR